MKTNKCFFRLLQLFCSFLLYSFNSYGQLTLDVGNDTTYCSDPNTTAIPMGIKVDIKNGVGPYTYAWECKIVPYGALKPQTASDVLNDSTLLSPTFINGVWLYADKIKFILHVTDHAGQSAKDSLNFRFVSYACILGYQVVELVQGDSVWLDAGKPSGSVAARYWEPFDGLSTPHSSATWCKPTVTTNYSIVGVDTSGCIISCHAYEIRVIPTKEFAPIGAEWYYSQYKSYNPPMANYVKHTCIKDSTIEGKRVKVIQKTNFRYGGVPVSMGFEYLHQHGDTIFYYKSGAFHELYNFSMSKGDSILLYSEMPNRCQENTSYGWNVVDSVYTTLINTQFLKTYTISPTKGSIWGFEVGPIIEKIGSLQYLLPQNSFCGFVDGIPDIGHLRCYTDPDLGTYHYGDLSCDTITTYPDGLSKVEKTSLFKVYPSPALEQVFVEGNFHEKEYALDLYSVKGELVKTECREGGTNIYRMDVGSLKSGIYILRMVSASGKYAEEVIVKN